MLAELILQTFIFKVDTSNENQNNRGGMTTRAGSRRSRHDDLPLTETNDGASGITLRQRPTRNMTETRPAERVLPESQPATTKAGKPRQRMEWSNKMNEDVMLCYYIVSQLESSNRSIGIKLHQEFMKKYPEYIDRITSQRLMDQKRLIVNRSKTDDNIKNTLERLKREASEILGMNIVNTSTDNNMQSQPINQHQQDENQQETNNNHTTHHEQTEEATTVGECPIRSKLEETMENFKESEPIARPHLPKLNVNQESIQNTIKINEIVNDKINEITNLQDLHLLLYCSAYTILDLNKQIKPTNNERQNNNGNNKKPKWEIRLEKKIEKLRLEVARVTEHIKGNIKKQRIIKQVEKLKESYKENNFKNLLDTLKQKLMAQSNRLRRYRVSKDRKQQNIMFANKPRIFYNNLRTERIEIHDNPPMDEIENYWKSIWSIGKEYNKEATWLEEEIEESANIPRMEEMKVTTEDVQNAIKRSHSWKAPGMDKIHNYWFKYITSTHTKLAELLNQAIDHPTKIPEFFTQGLTYLKPKTNETNNPTKYRPITCLPTIYKILTSVITSKVNEHLTNNNIMKEEQKGSRKNSKGCKEQLIIDQNITMDAKNKKKDLYCAFIDYQKAFDSIPHTWLLEILNIYQIDPKLVNFISSIMKSWRTTLQITTIEETLTSQTIEIKNGIFQGDSFSALWFCVALNPLSSILKRSKKGYTIKAANVEVKFDHLFYVDDLKLFASNKEDLNHNLQLTKTFSDDINMTFGHDKCKTCCIIKGKVQEDEGYELEEDENIESLEKEENYKYLGLYQNPLILQKDRKEEIKTKFKRRTEDILKTQLNGKNTATAINTFAIPVLSYSFGVIHWTDTDLNNINILIRATTTKHRKHHRTSAIERFHLPRKKGGRGVIDIKNLHNRQIENLRKFFYQKAHQSPMHHIITLVDRSPLYLTDNDLIPRIETDEEKIARWRNKAVHGVYRKQIEQDNIDKEGTHKWLTTPGIFAETEGFMMGIQDRIIKTRNYSKNVLKQPNITDQCRRCFQYGETIEHVTSGCSALANNEYTQRHDNVCKQLHQALMKKYEIISEEQPWYTTQPQPVEENEQVKIYYNKSIITDRTRPHNRPDIVLTIKEKKITYLIDIAIPNTNNLEKKHAEKIEKYIPLAEEIKQMWHQNTVQIVPVIISSTGVIPRKLHESLKMLQMKKNMYIQMQKSVIINTCSIVRRFLNDI